MDDIYIKKQFKNLLYTICDKAQMDARGGDAMCL